MGAREEAWGILKLNGSGWSKGMRQARREAEQFRREVNAQLKMVAAAIAGLGTSAAVIGAAFEQQQARIKAVSNASIADMRRLQAQARELGATTEHTALAAAQGQENLLRSGFKVNQVLKMMQGNLALASAGGKDMAFVAELQAAALKSFGLEAAESNRVVNLLQAATANTRFDLDRLNEAIKQGGSIANTYGVEIEESVAVMGVLVDVLGDGGTAGTQFKNVLAELTKKQREQKGVLGEVLKDWDPAVDGIVGAIERLENAGVSARTAMGELGAEAGQGLSTLMGRGSAAIRQLEKDITGTNAAFEAAQIQMNTTQGDAKTLISTLQELGLRVFDQINGPLRRAIQSVTKTVRDNYDLITDAVGDMVHAGEELIRVMSDVFALVRENSGVFSSLAVGIGVATTAMYALGTATAIWSAVVKTTPLGWLAVALGVVAAGIDYLVGKMGGWQVAWTNFMTGNKALWSLVTTQVRILIAQMQLVTDIYRRMPEAWETSERILLETWQVFGSKSKEFFTELGHGIWRALQLKKNPFEGLGTMLQESWAEVQETANQVTVGDVFGDLVEKYDAAREQLLAEHRATIAQLKAERDAVRGEADGASDPEFERMDDDTFVGPMPEETSGAAREAEEILTAIKGDGTSDRKDLTDEEVEHQLNAFDTVAAAATKFYSALKSEASKYTSWEMAKKLQVAKFVMNVAAKVSAAQIDEWVEEAAFEAKKEAAAALAAAARWDLVSAGKHLAAAAAYGGLAGLGSIASSALSGAGALQRQQRDFADDAADASADATGSGTRGGTIGLSGRAAPETVNIYVQTTVQGHVIGAETFVEEYIVPHLRLLTSGDAVSFAS